MIKGMTKNEYSRQYQRKKNFNKYCFHCIYCDVYCSMRDKHFKTEEHLKNISEKLNLNISFLR